MTDRQIKEVEIQSIRNLARGASILLRQFDMARTPGGLDWVSVEGMEHVDAALERGRGLIAFTAHNGCWEMMSFYMMVHKPHRVAVVYRGLDNPKLDRWLVKLRTADHGTVIERRRIVRDGIPWLKANKILGILVDQNFSHGGAFVPFLGRIAATTPIVSALARRTGAVVLPMHNRWEGTRLRIIWEAPLPLIEHPDSSQAVLEETARMNSIIERWIRQDPGQWLWMHNRWKRQPREGETVYSDGSPPLRSGCPTDPLMS